MPKIRFRSLPTGVVSVAVSQSDSTIRAKFGQDESIPDTGTPDTGPPDTGTTLHAGTAAIEVNRDRGTSPAGFFFSIKTEGFSLSDDTPFDPYSDLHYRWCFSDPGWYTRHDSEDLPWGRWYDVAGEHALFNDGSVPKGDGDVTFLGNDKDIAYGPHVCHVFAPADKDFEEETPDGTVQAAFKRFTVTCEIRNRWTDEVIEVTRDVLVDNPNAIFARGATYCISKDGPHGDEPIGSVWCATLAEAAAKSTGPNRRYLLRRGEEHEKVDKLGGSIDRCFLGSYGSSSEPAYIPVKSEISEIVQAWNSGGELAIYGIDLVGPYDPSDPYGLSAPPPKGITARGAAFKTYWDLKITGCYSSLTTKGPGANSNISIGNAYFGDYFDYGVYLHDGVKYFGACGLFSKQNPRTVVGSAKWPTTPPLTPSHAPLRVNQIAGPFALNLCDARSIGGWGGSMFQPSLRLGRSTNLEKYIEEAVVDRLRSEGGDILGSGVSHDSDPNHSGFLAPALPRKYIYDKIYGVIPQVQSGDGWGSFQVTGPVIRNSIVVSLDMPAVPRDWKDKSSSYPGITRWWHLEKPSSMIFDPLMKEFEVTYYSNTFVDMRPTERQTTSKFYPWTPDEMTLRVDNSVFAWPYGTPFYEDREGIPADVGVGNYQYVGGRNKIPTDYLDMTPLWRPTIPGYHDLGALQAGEPLNEKYAFPANGAPIVRPRLGSPFVGSADGAGHIAVDDFFGRIRGRNPSKGAVEPL